MEFWWKFFFALICLKCVEGFSANNSLVLSERTFDLSEFGIDVEQTFNNLLTPEGIVNQFAISFVLRAIQLVGYTVSGKNKLFLELDEILFLQEFYMLI